MRVAIIGVGAIAEIHARALADISSIELVSACCRTEEKGLRFAEQHDCSWYPDPVRMIRREKPDVVTIATPSGAHLEVALKAIRKGVHVLCEKPLEITTRRIDRMIRAAEKAGVSLGAIFPQRFNRFTSCACCISSWQLVILLSHQVQFRGGEMTPTTGKDVGGELSHWMGVVP